MPLKDPWNVDFSTRTGREKNKLPLSVQDQIVFLVKEMSNLGPYRKEWKNYGPLKKGKGIPNDSFHCHLKKGKPTYVACWRIVSKKDRLIEVFYVGTHENAPY